MAGPTQELIDAVNELAEMKGWSPQDILTIYSYETGGTMNPWQKGPTTKWGEHRGLIQWGEPQRKKYGVTADMSVRDQVMASGRYWEDRGAKPGMGILPLYAAVNGGNVNAVNASDEAAGGAPGTVTDKVNNQMEGHRKNAAKWTGTEYVPQPSNGVPYAGRASDTYHQDVLGQVPPEEDIPWQEAMMNDMVDTGKGMAKDLVMGGIKSALTGSGAPPPPPPPQFSAPPPMQRTTPRGPITLRKKKENKR